MTSEQKGEEGVEKYPKFVHKQYTFCRKMGEGDNQFPKMKGRRIWQPPKERAIIHPIYCR